MTDISPELVEQFAYDLSHTGELSMLYRCEVADTLRALSARLAEVEAECDAWIDGRIALEPARVTVGDNLERVARSIAKQAVNDENSWRDYTYAASAALRALADAGEAGE